MLVAVRHTLEVVVHVCEELLPPDSGLVKRAQLYLIGREPGDGSNRRLHLRRTGSGDAMCGLNRSLLVEADRELLWDEAPTELHCPSCSSTFYDQMGPDASTGADAERGAVEPLQTGEPEADRASAPPRWLPAFGFCGMAVFGFFGVAGGVPDANHAAGAWVPVGLIVLLLWVSRYTGIGSRPDDRVPLLMGMLTAAIPLALIQTARAVFA